MLHNQDFPALMETVLKEETEKAVDVKWKREENAKSSSKSSVVRRKVVITVQPTPTYISDERTNKKVYSETLEKPTPQLAWWNGLTTVGSKLRSNTPKAVKELDFSGLKVIRPVNDRLTTAIDYQNYRLKNN